LFPTTPEAKAIATTLSGGKSLSDEGDVFPERGVAVIPVAATARELILGVDFRMHELGQLVISSAKPSAGAGRSYDARGCE
jgi:hypothetical protein